MTANQLVAQNLKRARQHAGLTQAQAADRLEPYLGRRLNKANFSALERSAADGRKREFSADEILAFACAFELSVSYFFTPQEEEVGPINCGGHQLVEAPTLLAAVSSFDDRRLRAIYDGLPEDARPTLDQGIRRNVLKRLSSPTVKNITEHAANLRRAASALEAADSRVQGVFAEELDRAFGTKED
jgi:transcriptional regulator with XRE-family HTH domain